jgi:ATP/maltotriose-dependent transcriptional regulator MalT
VTGLAYCSMIGLCMQVFDLRRAQEWTAALGDWIEEQQGVVPYRGVCLVHRAEILQLRGAWPQAVAEAERACVWLDRSGEAAIGAAHYRVGELARLQGRLDEAERAYEQAIARGFDAQPGLARLRLAQGRTDAGIAGLDRALAEQQSGPTRAALLAARIDLALAVDDLAAARTRLAELAQQVGSGGAPFLRALAEYCAGTVLVAEGDATAALSRLRAACALWQELDAPYEVALTQLALARACAALGDQDAAAMGRDAARGALERLGATVDGGHPPAESRVRHPLSAREVEVLQLVATGASNRAIAQQLVLSEKTVARHLSNIFAKLELPSRSAATAYAYQHGLV